MLDCQVIALLNNFSGCRVLTFPLFSVSSVPLW